MTDLRVAVIMFTIPSKFIWQLHRRGIIGNPVSVEEIKGLAILGVVWGKTWFLRPQIARYSEARRRELFFKPELTKAERYILKCYLGIEEGKRLHSKEVIGRVKLYLGATVTEKQIQKIRSVAYEIRRGRRLGPSGEDNRKTQQKTKVYRRAEQESSIW